MSENDKRMESEVTIEFSTSIISSDITLLNLSTKLLQLQMPLN